MVFLFSLVEVHKAPTKSSIQVVLGLIFDLKQTSTNNFCFLKKERVGKHGSSALAFLTLTHLAL